MPDYSQYVKSDFIFHEPRELLLMPVSILLGVSQDAEEILKSLQIFSVFDLATSHIFGNARKIVEVAGSTNTIFGRYGSVPADVVDNDGHHFDVTELQMQPVELLEGIGPNNGPILVDKLQTQKIRDLALWPPYVAASKIVTSILTPEDTPEYDPEAPADLIPKSGEFPTEKVFYSTVVIDQIDGEGSTKLNGQIDLADISMGDVGFKKPATGAIITIEQAWYAQGVALGNLLHSVALAPGESTKIAMVDWSRQTFAKEDSITNQEESLSSESSHNRAISEVTNAVAIEAQGGFSKTKSAGGSLSSGIGFGAASGPMLMGGTQSVSGNASIAKTVSASHGRRHLMAEMNQEVTDSTQQQANSARTRRASVVQEVSQKEQETLTTRTVTNYNHMHALSVQYYEVVQIYRTTTRVNKVEKCVFVPMKIIKEWNRTIIDRYRNILYAAALNERARRVLAGNSNVVEIMPSLELWTQGLSSFSNFLNIELENARLITGGNVANEIGMAWNLIEGVQIIGISGQIMMRGVETIFNKKPSERTVLPSTQQSAGIDFESPIPITEIQSVHLLVSEGTKNQIEISSDAEYETKIILHLLFGGQSFDYSFPVKIKGENTIKDDDLFKIEVAKFSYSTPSHQWLITHLKQNNTYYSQAIWSNMDSATWSLSYYQKLWIGE